MLKDVWVVICPKTRHDLPQKFKTMAVHFASSDMSEQLTFFDLVLAYDVAEMCNGVVEHGGMFPEPSAG